MSISSPPTSDPPQREKIPYISQILDPAPLTPSMRSHPYPGSGTPDDPYVVTFIPSDPRNPKLYSNAQKWLITFLVAIESFSMSMCSSAYTGGAKGIMRDLGVGQEIFTLGLSLFVVGFAVGPLLWGPLSELYGRQIIYTTTFFCLVAFNAGCAASQNIESLLILRFLAGATGSSVLSNAPAVLSDIHEAKQLGIALAVFSLSPWMGPVLGPIVGGFVGETIGWRWLLGILTIFTGILWIAGTLLVPETYAPVLLSRRAARLSKITGQTYRSKADIEEFAKTALANSRTASGRTLSVGSAQSSHARRLFATTLLRPWSLLFTDLIVFILSIYMAIIYGILYMCFGAFPIVYQEKRHWSPGIGSLAFLGVMVGMILAVLPTSVLLNIKYVKERARMGGFALPEARLPPCMIGAVAAPVGLFWFAWTNGPDIHFLVSITAGGFFGFGLVLIFAGATTYLIDAYSIHSASVMAANAVMRSLFGAAFPMFTTYMFNNLGIHWASMIPAFLSLACLPFPFLFFKYGGQIRQRSRYGKESAAVLETMKSNNRQEEEKEGSAGNSSNSSNEQV